MDWPSNPRSNSSDFLSNKFDVYRLYLISQTTNQRPSDLLNLKPVTARKWGGIPDRWALLLFDDAVLYAGRYVDSKLHELDAKGRLVYSLETLLSTQKHTPNDMDMQTTALSAGGIVSDTGLLEL